MRNRLLPVVQRSIRDVYEGDFKAQTGRYKKGNLL